jgi:hypothetical protein
VAVVGEIRRVLLHHRKNVLQTMNATTNLIVYPIDFATQNVHVCTFAVGADFLFAVHAEVAVGFLRAHITPLHDLTFKNRFSR